MHTSAAMLYAQLALPDSPIVLDVRDEAAYLNCPRLIPGALRVDMDEPSHWAPTLPRSRPVLVYCSSGGSRSETLARKLIALGYPADMLDGGFTAWCEGRYPTVKARPELGAPGGSRWITREKPKIDRLACPWLIRRFIDPRAAFFYTPAHQVRREAPVLRAEPYDIADVVFSHRGPRCSFDAFIDEFDLHDDVLDQLAAIVRAADTGELANSREAPGLLAISLGLSTNIRDDIVLLEEAMTVYDALYAWCKKARNETHAWPQNPQ